MTRTTSTTQEAALEIAGLLVEAGHLTQEDLDYALRIRAKLDTPRPLVAVLQELELISEDQLRQTLQANRLNLRLGTLLLELGLISEVDLQAALGIHKEAKGKRLGEILVENHFVNEDEVLQVLAVQLGYRFITDDRLPQDKRLLGRVRPAWLQKNECFPLRAEDGTLLLACNNPLNSGILQEAQKFFAEPVEICLAPAPPSRAPSAPWSRAATPSPPWARRVKRSRRSTSSSNWPSPRTPPTSTSNP